jgi:iron(III) transport system ATP-binding protein
LMSLATKNTASGRRGTPWGKRGTAAATFAARLEFEHVSRTFDGYAAVDDVSFELAPGEIVCLLGPSGCGKTTLLRIAAGVERPDTGRVLLNGIEVSGPGSFIAPEKRGVGLMFQDFALFPHLTIFENVAFGLKSMDRATAAQEVTSALKRVGLAAYRDAYPSALSGGEQQRVALARALVPRPSVILMDEPFSGLDQRLRDSVREETLALLKETRSSCLLVTHDPLEAMWLADRIVLMRGGRLMQIGSPNELYNQPVDAEAAQFFSEFNEFSGTIENNEAITEIGAFKAPGIKNGTQVRVLVRPQGLCVAGQKTGIEGHVTSIRFLGENNLLTVAFQGRELPAIVKVPATTHVNIGDLLWFEALEEHVLVFPLDF